MKQFFLVEIFLRTHWVKLYHRGCLQIFPKTPRYGCEMSPWHLARALENPIEPVPIDEAPPNNAILDYWRHIIYHMITYVLIFLAVLILVILTVKHLESI